MQRTLTKLKWRQYGSRGLNQNDVRQEIFGIHARHVLLGAAGGDSMQPCVAFSVRFGAITPRCNRNRLHHEFHVIVIESLKMLTNRDQLLLCCNRP